MKDNTNNFWGSAPDKGSLEGPILVPINESMLDSIHGGEIRIRQNADSYWLSSLGSAGQVSSTVKILTTVLD